MTHYPAAYCLTCGKFLSPQGSRQYAREARQSHRDIAPGIHEVAIYESNDDYEEAIV